MTLRDIDWTGWLHLSVLGNTLAAWGIGLGLMLLVGSLPALAAELESLAGPLGLEGLEEPGEDAVFDEEADPLAAVKYAFYVLGSEVRRAMEIGLPLFVVYDGEEEEGDEGAHDGHDHGDLN